MKRFPNFAFTFNVRLYNKDGTYLISYTAKVSGENTLQVYLNPSTPALVTELVGGFSRTVTVKHGVFSAANTYVELASSAYDSMDAGKDISFAIMVGWIESITVPATVPATIPATVSATVPATFPATVPATLPATVPATIPAAVPQS